MITGGFSALLVTIVPYIVVMKVVGGLVDVTVHYAKSKIGNTASKTVGKGVIK